MLIHGALFLISQCFKWYPKTTKPPYMVVEGTIAGGELIFNRGQSQKHRDNQTWQCLPSGNLTQLWTITIFNGKIHYKWPFSIAILITRGYVNDDRPSKFGAPYMQESSVNIRVDNWPESFTQNHIVFHFFRTFGAQ